MAYTLLDIKNATARKLHGVTANQITDFYGLCFDAAVKVLSQVDPEETRRLVPLATPLYGQAAFDYASPSDLKGNRFIDLRPQANRSPSDTPIQQFSQDFDRFKKQVYQGSRVEVSWDTFVKSLRVALPAKDNVVLNENSSATSNGTWSAGGGASGLETDDLYFVNSPSSIRYSLSGNGYLENSTMTAINLTNYLDQAVAFVWTYCQGSNLPTSFNLHWGSGSSDYYSASVTSQADGTAFVNGWNLLGFQWQGASVTGTPDVTAINYARFTTNITGVATPVRLNAITFSLGQIYELEYYSKFLFRDSLGAFKEKPTADTDLINLDTDALGVYTNCLAHLAAQQQQGKDSSFDLPFFKGEYETSVLEYNRKYPSQTQKTGTPYYQVRSSASAYQYGRNTLRG